MKKCLSLHMLKSLYALDTKLDLNDICVRISNLPNLTVLAITEPPGITKADTKSLKNLKKLCLQCELRIGYYLFAMNAFRDCISLEELWLLDISNAWFRFDIKMATNSLQSFVTKSDPCRICTHWDIGTINTLTFKTKRGTPNVCLEYTKMNTSNIYEPNFYESLDNVLWATYLNELDCDYPFGLHDAKKLVYKQETFDSLYFQELSLTHMPILCCEKLQSTVVSILALPNTKLLRKLSINMCIFSAHSKTYEINEPLFKRSRTTEVSMKRSKLDVIVEHLPLLEELEIWECTTACGLDPDVLRPIGKLSKLKSLVLYYVSNIGNGKYLLDICKRCVTLTSLKIWSLQNTDLNNHLCMSIPYLRRLKDLRYQQPYLPLYRILESLASNDLHELERLVLVCGEIERFSPEPLKKFITQNPQLQLLYIVVKKLSKATQKRISKDLKEMKSDQQIFVVTNIDPMDKAPSLPLVHVLEMLRITTSVGVVHLFNDFH